MEIGFRLVLPQALRIYFYCNRTLIHFPQRLRNVIKEYAEELSKTCANFLGNVFTDETSSTFSFFSRKKSFEK